MRKLSLDTYLRKKLENRQTQNRFRYRLSSSSACDAEMVVEGRNVVNFSSNDYLGLANHSEVVQALSEGGKKLGVGSGASHLISGHHEVHKALEQQIAILTGRPRALFFANGYMANMGTLGAMLSDEDLIFSDELNHASLIDGCRLSRAKCVRFEHANYLDLQEKLSSLKFRHSVVVTDGVFSMDGDTAPLKEISEICSKSGAWLMVDDAHGFGVLGRNGGGLVEMMGLDCEQVPILVGTFGKSVGTYGAFVAGSDALIESLIQFSRTYIYTTALPPALAHATSISLKIVEAEPWRRERLADNIKYFRSGALSEGLRLPQSDTPIQPILIGNDERVADLGSLLLDRGFLVGAIRPPTVPVGSGRLRVSISAKHSYEQLDALISVLCELTLND